MLPFIAGFALAPFGPIASLWLVNKFYTPEPPPPPPPSMLEVITPMLPWMATAVCILFVIIKYGYSSWKERNKVHI